jgi:hypothetical protein
MLSVVASGVLSLHLVYYICGAIRADQSDSLCAIIMLGGGGGGGKITKKTIKIVETPCF